jgi:hypothetical protein
MAVRVPVTVGGRFEALVVGRVDRDEMRFRVDDSKAARTKAIEYFHVEPALQFRVVVAKLERVKTKETAAVLRKTPGRARLGHGERAKP